MHNQKGMTLIGLLLTVVIIVFLGILVMRVVPVYIQNYEIKRSLASLNNLDPSQFSSDPMANVSVLKSRLINQLDLESIGFIKPEQINITPSDGNYLVRLKYTVIKPLIANVSLMFDFEESEEVKVGPH
ncbi:transmembrane protein [Legionella quinlivanii]|uniref:Transmembrane protein n=1 Tax=Legionella quinlivanii TaxID=45073 RepID=A0A0W0XLJ6_9GAMM|nr:DUF4845 domain-containing protein [Legionella quinlivanii]KTD45347.1 transmembrane protein [Legionella quinlivanii]MCW8451400.1 DUF4845 domain-containing protein [Legionella quinlivanii]SEG15379.1 protein of unknown function [Legionella quinlivanii DSM 21216]STY10397.1 transmembrane protein [Legionella quinlivanii]